MKTGQVRHRLAVAGIGLGIAICGARESEGAKMTTVRRHVDCATCIRKTDERQKAAKSRATPTVAR